MGGVWEFDMYYYEGKLYIVGGVTLDSTGTEGT